MCVVYETEEEEEGLKISNIIINKKEKNVEEKWKIFFLSSSFFPTLFIHTWWEIVTVCLLGRQNE